MSGSSRLREEISASPVPLRADGREKRSSQVFWQRYFAVYDTLNEAIPYQEMVHRHVEVLAPKPGEAILDAGTGTGNIALALTPSGAQIVAFDFCEPALERCRAKLPDGDFRIGDLTSRLEFADETFDKIACCNVIYTLRPADQVNAVAELLRVLKPGGLAAITVFGDSFNARKVYRQALRRQREVSGLGETLSLGLRYSINTARIFYYVWRIRRRERMGAYTFYSHQEITDLIEGVGFKVLDIEPTLGDQCLLVLARKPTVDENGSDGPDPSERVVATSAETGT